jgi:hypothetical protein
MGATTHIIYLVGGADDETAEFTEIEAEDSCSLLCKYRDRQLEATADDFFQALCEVRVQLEAEGLLLFCYGGSLNVYPSAMSRQMAAGRAAYRMTLGKPALAADLVQIFAQAADVIPASVANQLRFFDEWFQSLG